MATPPFNISADAINRIAEISALLERHNIALEGEHGVKLRKANRIKTIRSRKYSRMWNRATVRL